MHKTCKENAKVRSLQENLQMFQDDEGTEKNGLHIWPRTHELTSTKGKGRAKKGLRSHLGPAGAFEQKVTVLN
jgi:hypothetical protein